MSSSLNPGKPDSTPDGALVAAGADRAKTVAAEYRDGKLVVTPHYPRGLYLHPMLHTRKDA